MIPITENSHRFAHSDSHGILQSSPVNSESTLSSWECSSETHSEDAKSDEEESENDECEKVRNHISAYSEGSGEVSPLRSSP